MTFSTAVRRGTAFWRSAARTGRDGLFNALEFICRYVAPSLVPLCANPSNFGPDYRSAHTKLAAPDVPYDAFVLAESLPYAPNINGLCGSSGVVNIGYTGANFVVRHKWLVRACQSRDALLNCCVFARLVARFIWRASVARLVALVALVARFVWGLRMSEFGCFCVCLTTNFKQPINKTTNRQLTIIHRDWH